MGYTIFGGSIQPEISLTIFGELPVSEDDVSRNVRLSTGLGLAGFGSGQPKKRRLAVVGGGNSINDREVDIKNFHGDVWAINGAWGWCRDRGIDATFISGDPHVCVTAWAIGAKRAILSSACDPAVFDLLKDAEIRLFDTRSGIKAGSSTATATPHLAAKDGYSHVTFFGCESSYNISGTHAYMDENRKDQMLVECNGGFYLTAPDFYLQAIELSMLIRELPTFLKEESGGLLRAMVGESEHHIKWVSEGLAANIKAVEANDAKAA